MTQRQITHDQPLPVCRQGHASRHIHDLRRQSAGGGHLVECRCCSTAKHATFEDALQDWKRINRIRTPRPPAKPVATVLQLPLRLQGAGKTLR